MARLLAETFKGKFAIALGRDPEARRRRIEALLPFNVVCQGHLYLYCEDDELVGSFTVKTAETTPSAEDFRKAQKALRAVDGWARAWWAITILRLFSGPKLSPTECYLDNLVTAKAHQRKGIASQMANELYIIGRSMGKTVLLGDVMSSNYRVIGLYEKEGWEVAGTNYWIAPISWPLLGTPGIIRIRKYL